MLPTVMTNSGSDIMSTSSSASTTIRSKISESSTFAFLTIFAVTGAIGHHLYVMYYLSKEYYDKFKADNYAYYADIGVKIDAAWVPGTSSIVRYNYHMFFYLNKH